VRTLQALVMHAARSISADEVVGQLEALVARRGRAPRFLRMDNGPELTSHALRDWCRFSTAQTAFIEPGCPWQNPFVESFHARVRDELLNGEQFACIAEAQVLIDDWREGGLQRPPAACSALRPLDSRSQWTEERGPSMTTASLHSGVRVCLVSGR